MASPSPDSGIWESGRSAAARQPLRPWQRSLPVETLPRPARSPARWEGGASPGNPLREIAAREPASNERLVSSGAGWFLDGTRTLSATAFPTSCYQGGGQQRRGRRRAFSETAPEAGVWQKQMIAGGRRCASGRILPGRGKADCLTAIRFLRPPAGCRLSSPRSGDRRRRRGIPIRCGRSRRGGGSCSSTGRRRNGCTSRGRIPARRRGRGR